MRNGTLLLVIITNYLIIIIIPLDQIYGLSMIPVYKLCMFLCKFLYNAVINIILIRNHYRNKHKFFITDSIKHNNALSWYKIKKCCSNIKSRFKNLSLNRNNKLFAP